MAEDYNELNHDEECWLPKAKDISVWHFDKWKVDKPEDVYTDVCTFDLDFSAVSYTHLTLPTNREV